MRSILLLSFLCLASPVLAGDDPLDAIPEGRVWQVTEVAGTPVPDGVEVSITRLKEGILGGSAGCNSFTLRIGQDHDRLFPGPMMTTKMMCDPAAMQVERAFAKAMEAVNGLRHAGDTLTLTDATGAVVIRATR